MIRVGYLTITPEKTGQPVVGPSVYKMAPDTIEILEMSHQVSHEYDPKRGVTSSDRKHEPLIVVKEVDVTTPLLNFMCANAEMLKEVKLQYFKQIGNATDPVPFFTWTLTDAIIIHVKPFPIRDLGKEFEEEYDLVEEIAFAYQRIKWEHHAHRAPIGLKELPTDVKQDAWSPVV